MEKTLENYLIPDIVNTICDYAWGDCVDVWKICRYGNYDLAILLEEKNLEIGLLAACGGGFENIVSILYGKCIQNNITLNLSTALTTACRNKQKKMVVFMIKKGAEFCFLHNRQINKCLSS